MTDPDALTAARAVLDRRRDELIARYAAAGVGVGCDDGAYVIVVYLKSEARRPRGRVAIDGVPLKFTVTGPFRTNR